MTEEQEYLFGLVGEIDQICRKHGITYYFMAGTLIGALRHEGFLPWDDDADIFMTNAEFARFVKACETDLPPHRALRVPGRDLDYTNNFPRYVSTQTTAIHSSQVLGEGDVCGDVIDIFVLDPIADGQEALDAYTHDLMIYSDVLSASACYARRYGIAAEEVEQALRLDQERGRAYTCDFYESRLASYFDEGGKTFAARWGGLILIYPRWMFGETIECTFEGRSFLAPRHFNEYLRQHYGDEWTNLPPHAERVSHDAAYSLRVPYTQALEYYQPLYDHKTLRQQMQKRSVMECRLAPEAYAQEDEHLRVAGWIARLECQQLIDADPQGFGAALEKREGRDLLPFVAGLITWQLNRDAIGREDWRGAYRMFNPFLGDFTDQQRAALLLALAWTERIGWARRMLQVIRHNRGSLTELEREVQDMLESYAQATDAYWLNDLDRALSLANRLLAQYPTNGSFVKMRLRCLEQLQGVASPEFLQILEYGERTFPEDGVFMKYRADVLLGQGCQDQALELYRRCVDCTNDGMVHLDVKKKTGFIPSWIRQEFYEDAVDPLKGDAGKGEDQDEDAQAPQQVEANAKQLKQRFFHILCTLADICRENGIEYFLSAPLAHSLWKFGKLPGNSNRYCLLLRAPQMLRLIQVLKEQLPSGFDFEYMGNSEHLGEPTLYFYDTSTTMYRKGVRYRRKHCSFFVIARMLNSQSYAKMNTARFKAYQTRCGLEVEWKSDQQQRAQAYLESQAGATTPQLGQMQLEERVAKYDPASEVLCIDARGGRRFSAEIFQKTQQLDFQGASLSVPARLEDYVSAAAQAHPVFAEDEPVFPYVTDASLTVPWVQVAQGAGFDPDLPVRRRALMSARSESVQIRQRFDQTFAQIKRAVALKDASLDLAAKEQQVLAAWRAQDHERVLELLADYCSFARENARFINLNVNEGVYAAFVAALEAVDNPVNRRILADIQAFSAGEPISLV